MKKEELKKNAESSALEEPKTGAHAVVYPLPFESVKKLRQNLLIALNKSKEKPEHKNRKGEIKEGPSSLAKTLERLKLYAYPNDHADWNKLKLARDHIKWMSRAKDFRWLSPIPAPTSDWEFIGPRRFDTGGGKWVSGRINAIAIDPVNNAIVYVGASGGGVWKTFDGGVTWQPLSNTWPFEEISSIAIAPNDNALLYVGTGDFQGWSSRHFGLMKSTDGGISFINIPAGEAADTSISGIVIDPDDSSIVTICGGRGRTRYGFVWRTINGGVNWVRVVNVPAEWAKIVIGKDDGNGTRAMYVVGWNGGGGVIYRSLDRGANWVEIFPPWMAGQWGISVAVSLIDPKRVYVMAGADRKVYTSDDYGNDNTWTDVTDNLRQDDFEWSQLWYDWDLACGSTAGRVSHDVLFVGLLHLNYWDSILRSWVGIPSGHDDQHVIAVDPKDPNRFLLGNDGGIYELTRIAAGWDVTSLNGSLGITECYRGHASQHNLQICLAATQDNAVGSSQKNLNSWGQVFPPTGGDAMAGYVSPTNPLVQFVEGGVAFWGISRTDDGWSTQKEITPPAEADRREPFSMPITMDVDGTRLYWGSNYLWIRDEATGNWSSRVGGQKLAGGTDEAVKAIGVAPSNRERVYTGSADGQLWKGDGPNWIWNQINAGLPDRSITCVSVHPTNQDDIIVSLAGTGSGHIWRCRDTSRIPMLWEDISGGGSDALPDIPAVGIVRDPRAPDEMFYAGTDIGVFYTGDGGKHWTDLTIPHGLPAAQLSDLQLVGRNLYAMLFGRGVWRLRLPITQTTPASASIGATIFAATTTIDGRILLCQTPFGQAFSEWHQIAGNGRTDAQVALASVENTLFIFCKGLNNKIYVNQAELTANNSAPEKFAQSFSGWFELQGNGLTDTAPAATRIKNSVFVFVKGLDGRIYLNQAEYRKPFSGWFELDGNGATDVAPACATVSDVVFCFVKGLDGHVYVNQAEYGHHFSGWFEVQGGGETDVSPAATSIDQTVFVFIKGINGRIYLNQAELGHAFSGWFEVQGNGYTELAPAASSVLQSVFVFALGLDCKLYMNQAEYRHAFSGWFPLGDEAP